MLSTEWEALGLLVTAAAYEVKLVVLAPPAAVAYDRMPTLAFRCWWRLVVEGALCV